jgi:hypothetical protein
MRQPARPEHRPSITVGVRWQRSSKLYDGLGRNTYDESAVRPNYRTLIVRPNPKTGLRPQFGAKSYDRSGQNAYDGKSAAPKIHALIVCVASPLPPNHSLPSQMRSQRGNLAAKYDRTSANCQKRLRGQFGRSCDQKKVGNSYIRLF